MIVQARDYTSADEMRASAHALHQKLMNTRPAKKVAVVIAPKVIALRPSWRRAVQPFDAHVKDWQLWCLERMSPCKAHMRRRCEDFGITMEELTGRSRRHPIVEYRQLVMWEIKTIIKPEISYPEIGRLFGGKDHTTALWAVRRVAAMKAAQ
ncbi:Chromosomal replication initiator protein dnaA [Rhizobium favelukesii]|uniref:Chromosomal replication initiator protein dnaA n=1 Tax=Rhizobium favelukesii TaxID=348824 RepID=W6R9Q8_9HYPH|nr:helix-turn-helix domain-containing protein [Rhizobium favelukesii]CDM57659.1 Chromosomal replication initiator protein dnaA [Rhizobium favelukesii]